MSRGVIWTPDIVNCLGCDKRMDIAEPGATYTTLNKVDGRPNMCMECYQEGLALMSVLVNAFKKEGGQLSLDQIRQFARELARRGGGS